jgi:MTH538 TIR-like domain (DUF1863)
MAKEIRNVFISHIHEDDARLGPLKELLAKQGCEVRDSSINSNKSNNARDPDYIRREILAPRIEWASTIVVLVTPDTKDSDWVNWEIEYAQQMDKRIVGVWDRGEMDCEIPEALDQYADAIVPWRAEQVAAAIMGRMDGSLNAKGEPRQPRNIARYSC